ncbi:MarR family transcriptional regulator [Nocardia amamiensis]|uniref:MarR family transcriptional regulator n=1 Tax=Nocardia amamiensis TaxID=404578 RepID=A0ABS0CS65_9NOCA|nr:helix-turn-helix domain-containing protein [Nocardia amamiensis]MBF6299141.1 MarR family transcriptional regulator [Nocardia amamiensis]
MATGTAAETAVLAVLAPGGMLTATQITQQAQLTGWSVRRAIGQLEGRGLIMCVPYASRWAITPRGRSVWATKGGR